MGATICQGNLIVIFQLGMLNIPCIVFCVLDVVSIEKTGENFRLLYDVKGRFTVHRITGEEAKVS